MGTFVAFSGPPYAKLEMADGQQNRSSVDERCFHAFILVRLLAARASLALDKTSGCETSCKMINQYAVSSGQPYLHFPRSLILFLTTHASEFPERLIIFLAFCIIIESFPSGWCPSEIVAEREAV